MPVGYYVCTITLRAHRSLHILVVLTACIVSDVKGILDRTCSAGYVYEYIFNATVDNIIQFARSLGSSTGTGTTRSPLTDAVASDAETAMPVALAIMLLANGLSFHLQSISAYGLMGYATRLQRAPGPHAPSLSRHGASHCRCTSAPSRTCPDCRYDLSAPVLTGLCRRSHTASPTP